MENVIIGDKRLMNFKKKVVPVLKRNDVVHAGIFGSFARGEAKKRSDIDILIEFKGRKSLLDLVGVKLELEETLKRKVDVVEYSTIHSLLREKILKEEVPVL
jgi:predicted nucleotidyltransferase